jgi:hypothetical protein
MRKIIEKGPLIMMTTGSPVRLAARCTGFVP